MLNDIRTNLKNARDYNEKEVVRIVNEIQWKKYVKHGAYPIDMYPSVDKDGKDIIVHIFLKEDTRDLFDAWLAHELD